MAAQVTSFKGKIPEILPGGNFGSTTLCTFRSLCHLAERKVRLCQFISVMGKTSGKTPSFSTHQVSQEGQTTPRNSKRLHFISHRPPQTLRKVPLASRASDPWPPRRCNATLNICQVPPLVSGDLGGGSHGSFLMSLASWLRNDQHIKYLQRSSREKL